MTIDEVNARIRSYELGGEKLISNIRLVLAAIYIISMFGVSIIRNAGGYAHIPGRSYIFTGVFLAYSVFMFFYVRGRESISDAVKYACVAIDMTLISASIWVSATYPEVVLPVTFISIQAMFYNVLIMTGTFRYNVRCAYFSGIYAAATYMAVVLINRNVLDLPYFVTLDGVELSANFPVYSELFRVLGMLFTGWIAGRASKRRLELFNSMIESQSSANEAVSKTVEQTRTMAKTIRKSTDEICLSSKGISSTANNQAASIQEIKNTISENTQIAAEIAEKTGSVANITTKMENDIANGFSLLKRNVKQMEGIKNKNDGVISSIVALGNKITKIREIIKTINVITDQTKVIAFNAALESASAGERGKRFSAVAGEVNRLADDIAALTKKIREQLEEIQASSSSLIISSEESADKIAEGNNLIRELEDTFREIRSGAEITSNQAQMITVSTHKQQKSAEQINIAIEDISAGLGSFLQSTEVATASTEGLTRMIEELGDLLDIKDETSGAESP